MRHTPAACAPRRLRRARLRSTLERAVGARAGLGIYTSRIRVVAQLPVQALVMAGLGVAAYAVYGEGPEAREWAALARAIYSKVLETYSKDGYYYEGFEYWIFSTPWILHYLDAQKHATGEDLFDQPGLRKAHLYAAHDLEDVTISRSAVSNNEIARLSADYEYASGDDAG